MSIKSKLDVPEDIRKRAKLAQIVIVSFISGADSNAHNPEGRAYLLAKIVGQKCAAYKKVNKKRVQQFPQRKSVGALSETSGNGNPKRALFVKKALRQQTKRQ